MQNIGIKTKITFILFFIAAEQTYSQTDASRMLISFHTITDEYPCGLYWPAPQIVDQNGNLFNPSSIFIEPDDSYSDITESNVQLIDEKARYIGYFTKYETDQTVYLYGTKDPVQKMNVGDGDGNDDEDSDSDDDSQDDDS